MSTPFPLHPGQILDRRYTILEQLGHGGFGRTYLATDSRRHDERCVLKEFAPLMTAQPQDVDKARELFRREAAVLHQLRHPQIPEFREEFEVYDQGQARWILVQQWIEGETYLNLLHSGPFLAVQVLQFLRDFLPILDYLHHHQPPVIHRDIALDNILLNSVTNQPTLIDFGTVKQALNPVTHAVEQATFVAKQGYSPPELALGNAYPASDLYALGVCAIALLTGQPNPALLYDAHQDRWHWRSHVAPGSVSPALGLVLDRLLQSQPRHRYDSAAQVLAALGGLEYSGMQPGVQSGLQPNLQPGVQPGGDRPGSSTLPNALQQALTVPPYSRAAHPSSTEVPQGQQSSTAQPRRATPYSTGAPQRTVAIGRPLGRPAVEPQTETRPAFRSGATQSEATEYIWPLWARPLLFAQPLLALLAFRVGPALLVGFLLYGGLRQAAGIVTAQFSSQPDSELQRKTPDQAAPDQEISDQEASGQTAAADESTESSQPEIALPDIQLPSVKLPSVKLPELPEITIPKLPTIELPSLEWPAWEWPQLGLGDKDSVKGCRKRAIARFQKLPPEQASWGTVDQQFAEQYPDHPKPLEPDNPEHSTYIEAWCEVAHNWLDGAEAP